MMDFRTIQDLGRFVNEINKKLAASEKFFTGKLASRLTKAARDFPHDQTIVQMANFLIQRANNPNGMLISRTELKTALDNLWTNDTQCTAFLKEELGENPNNLVGAKLASPRHEHEGELVEDVFSKYADRKLVSEFEAAFDKNATYKPYDPAVAKNAENVCRRVLPGNPVVRAVDGRDFAILCQATYETPRGQSNVLVPVEVSNGYALIPNTFLGQDGFKDLSKEAIERHITTTAGRYFRVDAGHLFEAIQRVKFAGKEEVFDEVDEAVFKLKMQAAPQYTPDGILYQEVDPAQNDVNIPQSPEVKSFAEELGNTNGSAEFVFGKNTVETGKGLIYRMLQDFGYNNAQVKVADFSDNSIIYVASVNGAGIKIPIKVSKNNGKFSISRPTTILAGGAIDEFTRQGIMSALGTNDQTLSSVALGYDLKNPQSLIGEVESACEIGDLKRAGEAVAALEASGDQRAFSYGFNTYMDALNNGTVKKEASQKPKMQTMKIGGNLVEATTGLPVDKVYIDENGNVQAKYRQHMEKTEEGMAGGFMNAKIIAGL